MALIESLFASGLATRVVYWLRHRARLGGIRAASLTTLAFSGVARASGWEPLLSLEPVVFGASFCAMSEPHRLSEGLVLIAGLVFGFFVHAVHRYGTDYVHGGIGGTLGGCAFVACLFVYLVRRGWRAPCSVQTPNRRSESPPTPE